MRKALSILASLRLTLVGMVLLAALALASYKSASLASLWLVVPLALLALNLAAAIVSNPRFRRQPALLVFHLCLLTIVVLAGVGLMTRLEARVEIAEGQVFDPAAVEVIGRGPWYRSRLQEVKFVQDRIEIDYAPGLRRGETRSAVRLAQDNGHFRGATLSNNRSLEAAGYRFAPTANKGIAAILTWLDDSGRIATGAIHFPSYPLYEWKQENTWRTPRGESLVMVLQVPKRPSSEPRWTFKREALSAQVLVKRDARTVQLRPGESIRLEGGSLRLDDIRLWMGYRIDYNPVLPWLLATALIAVLALAAHFRRRFWQSASQATELKIEPVHVYRG